jgi:hypothetical protein
LLCLLPLIVPTRENSHPEASRDSPPQLLAAVAMHIASYNFVWRLREKGTSGRKLPTPAMQAGLVDRLWMYEDLYDNVMQTERDRVSNERYRNLTERLGKR